LVFPEPSVIIIGELGVSGVTLTHTERKVAIRDHDEEIVMVRHKTISMTETVIPFCDMLVGVEKCFSLMVVH
jgi:hypothetical protein